MVEKNVFYDFQCDFLRKKRFLRFSTQFLKNSIVFLINTDKKHYKILSTNFFKLFKGIALITKTCLFNPDVYWVK